MVILHIAAIENNMCNGVNVIVPQHIKAQSKYADIAFINVKNIEIYGIKNQFKYSDNFAIDSLPYPFNAPQLVVFHEAYRVEYIRISKLLRKQGIPYIIVPHGELTVMAQRKKWLKKKVANILLFNRFIKSAKALQVLSENELGNTRFKVKKIIGTNGIDVPCNSKQVFSYGAPRFIYIGRLELKIKGLDLLLAAVADMAEFLRSSHIKFHLYGPDYKGRFLAVQTLIEEKAIEDIVILSREVVGEKKIAKLLESDVFIQTSRTEGMPLGVLEALSYGIPCLVTEGTSMAGLITEYNAGWGCGCSVDDIKQAIFSAIQQQDLYVQKSKNAKQLIKEKFCWDNIAEKTINEYKKLIDFSIKQ